ncbi:alpha/beta hydrolase family protein [Nocardia brasiliensis]
MSSRGWCARSLLAVGIVCAVVASGAGPAASFPIPTPPAPVPTATPLGPHPVGVHVQTFEFEGRPLRVTTWYPATATGRAPYVTQAGISGTAVEDAPADRSSGPYPLIVFSPGLGATGDGYYFYTQNLASAGYVVIGIDHWDATATAPGFGLADIPALLTGLPTRNMSDSVFSVFRNWFRATEFGMTYRPQEIGFALDAALRRDSDAASPLSGLIDANRIGMSGQSLGATYTLLKGGMSVRCDHARQQRDVDVAAIVDIDPCALPAFQALAAPDALRDPRIKAILAMAPPTFLAKNVIGRGAADIEIPLMFLNGDDPYWETQRDPQWTIYSAAAGPKYFVEIKNTDHMVVCDSASLNPLVRPLLPPWDHRPQEFAAKANAYMRYSTAFFDRYLNGDPTADDVLTAPLPDQVAAMHHG